MGLSKLPRIRQNQTGSRQKVSDREIRMLASQCCDLRVLTHRAQLPLCSRCLALWAGRCLSKAFCGLQRILKDLYGRLGRTQLIRPGFMAWNFRVNVLYTEELVIGQGQQRLELFRG